MDRTPPTVQGTTDVGVHVTPELKVPLYAIAGPVFDARTGLDFSADTLKNPWWTLTAPLQVTARPAAPAFKLDSGSLTLYQHTFGLAQATPAGTTPKTRRSPSSAAHVGTPVDVADTLPADLSPNKCVVLLLNQSFSAQDTNALRTNDALNQLATDVGAGIQLDDDLLDSGDSFTGARLGRRR